MAIKKPKHIDKTVAVSIPKLNVVILGHKLKKDTTIIPSTKPNNIDLCFCITIVTSLDIVKIPIATPKAKNINGYTLAKFLVRVDTRLDTFSYSPNINKSKEPDIPGITIATAAAMPQKNNLIP